MLWLSLFGQEVLWLGQAKYTLSIRSQKIEPNLSASADRELFRFSIVNLFLSPKEQANKQSGKCNFSPTPVCFLYSGSFSFYFILLLLFFPLSYWGALTEDSVVDPFREQLTVECESVQLTVAFRDVLPPPVFTPVVKRKRPVAPRVITPSEPAPTSAQVPTPVSSTAPQFMAIVRPDGTEIGCGAIRVK